MTRNIGSAAATVVSGEREAIDALMREQGGFLPQVLDRLRELEDTRIIPGLAGRLFRALGGDALVDRVPVPLQGQVAHTAQEAVRDARRAAAAPGDGRRPGLVAAPAPDLAPGARALFFAAEPRAAVE